MSNDFVLTYEMAEPRLVRFLAKVDWLGKGEDDCTPFVGGQDDSLLEEIALRIRGA